MNLLTLLTVEEKEALIKLSSDLQISLKDLLDQITESDQLNEQIAEFLLLFVA